MSSSLILCVEEVDHLVQVLLIWVRLLHLFASLDHMLADMSTDNHQNLLVLLPCVPNSYI